MGKNKKYIFKVIIFVAAIVVAGVWLNIYVIDGRTDDNWLTYTSQELGIAISYPENTKNGPINFFESDSTLSLQAGQDNFDFWKITVADIFSEDDLDGLMRSHLGESFADGCQLGNMMESNTAGIYDVSVVPTMPDAGGNAGAESSCWINWPLVFKYSPEHHRAAIWNLGQEPIFLGVDCDDYAAYCTYDQLMAESLKFISES